MKALTSQVEELSGGQDNMSFNAQYSEYQAELQPGTLKFKATCHVCLFNLMTSTETGVMKYRAPEGKQQDFTSEC